MLVRGIVRQSRCDGTIGTKKLPMTNQSAQQLYNIPLIMSNQLNCINSSYHREKERGGGGGGGSYYYPVRGLPDTNTSCTAPILSRGDPDPHCLKKALFVIVKYQVERRQQAQVSAQESWPMLEPQLESLARPPKARNAHGYDQCHIKEPLL